jgi:alpha(1,3/1,4) fucosyltransferase
MEKLRIKFVDFWTDMNRPEGNYFYDLLSQKYEVEFSDDPEILFYSTFGNKYLEFDCLRVFYTAENRRPDFSGCDFAITFDLIEKPNHFRFPLFGMYCYPDQLLGVRSKTVLLEEWRKKEKFCCMVVSNGASKKRIDFFHHLSKYKKVDSGGSFLNNVGGPVKNKLEFISGYKFVFAFENSAHPGYTTEKIIEPLIVGSIPVYWGNPLVGQDINGKRIINYDDYENEEVLIQDLLAIECDEERALEILSQPVFPDDSVPFGVDKGNVTAFLGRIIDARGRLLPVARQNKRIIHSIKRKGKAAKGVFMRFWDGM